MKPVVLLIVTGMSLAGATGRIVLAGTLPVPPIPPQNLPLAERAPVPDFNARAPSDPASEDPSYNVRLYRAHSYDPSLGFAPGSRYQSNEDRKPIQTPGFSITVPLQ